MTTDTAAPRLVVTAGLVVAKGHGTKNDFVLIDDRDGLMDLTPALVRSLCDRRAGVGADGVIRLIASERLPEGAALLAADPDARWFMDYRNADGSLAQMCGNGVRVLAALVRRLGLWEPSDGELVLGTRAGVRRVREVPVPAGIDDERWYSVDMGVWSIPGGDEAVQAGGDARVTVSGLPVARPGLGIDMGNPHTVLVVADADELEAADLTRQPVVRPVPPDGTNTELVLPLGERAGADGRPVGAVRMRVFERGVGETASCGTGACAAALAVRAWAGGRAPDEWLVHVPGGTLRVTARPDGHVELAGPAVLVADATVDLRALPTS